MHVIRKIGSKLYAGWMLFAKALAFVNTRVLLTLVYALVIGPISLFLRIFGKDSLERKFDPSNSYWKRRETASHTIKHAARQF